MRKIPLNYRNVTGIFPSRKSKNNPRFESTLEAGFLALLEFSPEVSHFDVQPVEITWEDEDGRSRRYTPDVLVHYWDEVGRAPSLVEVKYLSELKEKWESYAEKFGAASAFSRDRGWVFRIVTDTIAKSERAKNASFLNPFVARGLERQNLLEELDDQMRRLRSATVQQLLGSLRSDPWQQAELIPVLWFMLGTFQIAFDVDSKLTMSSRLWDIPEERWSDSEIGRWNYISRQREFLERVKVADE